VLYEEKKLGKISIIHGDTVFTNILINKFGKIKLIDPRGSIDNINTILGDELYDYAKIYQSLLGYDEILINKKISISYKNKFLEYFTQKMIDKFGLEIFFYLKVICASLLFTLIPLHNNDKCMYYYNLIDKLNLF
jgi:thiamine kinase-like enzyme